MAAGGVFTPGVPQVRPGTYINIKSSRKPEVIYEGTSGIAVIPFFNHPYGITHTMIEINSSNKDSIDSLIGFDLNSNNANIKLVREAFKACPIVKVYIAQGGNLENIGAKASKTSGKITATAKYAGTRGNDISFSIIAETDDTFTLNVYLESALKSQYSNLETISDVVSLNDPYVSFSSSESDKEIALIAVASANLENGTDASTTNADATTFLDALDSNYFNSVLCPINAKTAGDNASMIDAFVSKIKYLNNKLGKNVEGVVINKACDYEGIINVTNAPIVDGSTDIVATAAFVTALYAGSDAKTTNTSKEYPGATGFDKDNSLNYDEVCAAIKNGEFVFTLSDSGAVVVEYDINSLVTIDEGKDDSFKKNRTIRVFAEICDRFKEAFPPGKFNNDEDGFNLVDGICASILNACQKERIIKNVEEGDALVDRANSIGDALLINVSIQPVDSAEKIYISVITS